MAEGLQKFWSSNLGRETEFAAWAEQDSFSGKLTEHLRDMAEFDVNTGLRDHELCGLKWVWEHRVPELDTPGIQRSVLREPCGSAIGSDRGT